MTLIQDTPQHLLGGLNVALLISHDSSREQMEKTRGALEEMGVTVSVLASGRSAVQVLDGDGLAQSMKPHLAVAVADPDAFDGVVVIASPQGGARLALDGDARQFLARLDAEAKPIGAISDGVLPVLSAGLGAERELSTPEHLVPAAEGAGAVVSQQAMAIDEHLISLTDPAGLDRFISHLKGLLAGRRVQTMAPGGDVSSAVGEGG
ncbi:DJ-1/PfpI family protein [Ramlibacter sp. AW1]|uniref:DJ-1/PfpI family protein n=1 Tax=Ramlibacter aurantiacus TaxID=2801330 RepID=A0A936ZMM1_9BURK|nr:DJ-1/PfpI family protein [Ramlibacter aurantiacus]MBL0418976.1 DJ-1/PfpI family protein [Ramlibacter aurantiacus]